MTKPNFDIPTQPNQSCTGARRAYFDTWQREWPHSDDYLRTLAREVPATKDMPPNERNGFSRCQFLLDRMRECHPFQD